MVGGRWSGLDRFRRWEFDATVAVGQREIDADFGHGEDGVAGEDVGDPEVVAAGEDGVEPRAGKTSAERLKIAALVDQLLTELPNLPPTRPFEIADALGRSNTGFATLTDLLTAGIAAAVRETARGRGDPEQERQVALRSLDAWGEVWQGLSRLRDETERFTLGQSLVVGLVL